MAKLTKARVEQVARAFLKNQQVPKDVHKPLHSARAAEKLATHWLRSTGFDVRKEQALQKQLRAERDRSAATAAAHAAKRWAGHTKRMQASAAAWASNMMTTAVGAPPSRSFFIGQPISILASDPKMLRDTHIESGNSFAKIRIDRKSSNVDTLSFLFGFLNAAAAPLLFDFDTLLNASGHLSLSVGAGFLNSGEVTVDAKLDVLASSQISDSRNVTTLAAVSDGPPFFGGASNDRTFSLTRFLTAPGIVLDANEIAILVVSLAVKSELDDSRLVADFNAGNFRVLCPVILGAVRALPMKASGFVAASASVV
jgi:hypothetical protein